MRSFVEANQEIGRRHVRTLDASGPDAGPSAEPDMEAFTELVERAINGVELPEYAGSGRSAASLDPTGTAVSSSRRSATAF
jgi:hypothetical protein